MKIKHIVHWKCRYNLNNATRNRNKNFEIEKVFSELVEYKNNAIFERKAK